LGAAIAGVGNKVMSDHVSGQKSIAAAFNTNIDVITLDLQKIQRDRLLARLVPA
jgi:hypothetical protein